VIDRIREYAATDQLTVPDKAGAVHTLSFEQLSGGAYTLGMALQPTLESSLATFKEEQGFVGVGAMGTALVLTRKAREKGLPLDPNGLTTPGGGQVSGLSGTNINRILGEYGVTHRVGTESGRTSRGTPTLAKTYATFMNGLAPADIEHVEGWWVARFVDYFNSQPFKLNYDASRSLAAVIEDLLAQATARQKKNPGTMYAGAVLQHLIGAKLVLALPELTITHNGASVADAVSSRSGDFVLDNAIIHCTMAPGDALMQKCKENLRGGLQPIILTVGKGVGVAQGLSETHGIEGRVEVMDALQFLAANLYEMSLFKAADRRIKVAQLVEKYNEIVAANEADASLRIAFD
jgi:hypothetical protein